MVIIITGPVGIGKSTICQKVLASTRRSGYTCGGIITLKTLEESLSVMNVRSEETAVLAIPGDRFGGPLTPRFTFDPKGIDFGLKSIEEGSNEDILFVDEIGIIECMGEGFIKALDVVNKTNNTASILVIRKELLEYLVPGLDREPVLFEATGVNRNDLPARIIASIPKQRDQLPRT